MTHFDIHHRLPFVSVSLFANNQTIVLPMVLIDTGSAASVFKTEALASIGIIPSGEDTIRFMTGIGGREAVIEKQIEAIEVGEMRVSPFTVQIGSLNYGLSFDGILGADFFIATGALIDFKAMTIRSS